MKCKTSVTSNNTPLIKEVTLRYTIPSLNPLNKMSPPSSCTVGRIRVSRSSLIMAVVSSSSSSHVAEKYNFLIFLSSKRDKHANANKNELWPSQFLYLYFGVKLLHQSFPQFSMQQSADLFYCSKFHQQEGNMYSETGGNEPPAVPEIKAKCCHFTAVHKEYVSIHSAKKEFPLSKTNFSGVFPLPYNLVIMRCKPLTSFT